MPEADPRRQLLDGFHAALTAVDGRRCVAGALTGRALPTGPVHLVAIGKAADAMTRGAVDALGDGIADALVITKHGHAAPGLPGRVIEAGHPEPDAASLTAGAALLAFIDAAPADAVFLFLISGGTSALAEALPPGLDLDHLRRANAWLLASGHDIAAMNAVRKGLSRIKGGRLAARLDGRAALGLLISDVPGDDPATIGSGPLAPAPAPALPEDLPPWLVGALAAAPPQPAPDDPVFRNISLEIVADNARACAAAARAGEAAGLTVHRHATPIHGDAVEWGRATGAWLAGAPAGLHVWGGESTTTLPSEPGRGGRNQALGLAAATAMAGVNGVWLLAAGTDGTDGPTDDAGALVDGGTVARGEVEGLDAAAALTAADSGRFLEVAGDLVTTGPTGTNVMDLVLALHLP